MVCQASAYRVLQEVPVDFEGEDGLILPTVDYVEEDALKSPHGWIQVHNSLLVRPGDTFMTNITLSPSMICLWISV